MLEIDKDTWVVGVLKESPVFKLAEVSDPGMDVDVTPGVTFVESVGKERTAVLTEKLDEGPDRDGEGVDTLNPIGIVTEDSESCASEVSALIELPSREGLVKGKTVFTLTVERSGLLSEIATLFVGDETVILGIDAPLVVGGVAGKEVGSVGGASDGDEKPGALVDVDPIVNDVRLALGKVVGKKSVMIDNGFETL